jgi:hypothetical protein
MSLVDDEWAYALCGGSTGTKIFVISLAFAGIVPASAVPHAPH